MLYFREKRKRLESWLATARESSRQQAHIRKSSSSKGSILSSIFESDRGCDTTGEISKQLKGVEISAPRKRKEFASFSTDENIKSDRKNDESSLEDVIEGFTDDEAESSDKRHKLPDLDEEVIRGFDQNGLVFGKVDSQDVNEQLSQNADYYMDAGDVADLQITDSTIQGARVIEKSANRRNRKQAEKDISAKNRNRVKGSKITEKTTRDSANASRSDGDDEVFYDALPDIKTTTAKVKVASKKVGASSAAETYKKSRYRTRGTKHKVSYKEDSGSSEDDDTLQNLESENSCDEKKMSKICGPAVEKPKTRRKGTEKAIVQKSSAIKENLPKPKNAPKHNHGETKDSTFLSDILGRIAQVSQNDVTIDDITLDDDILGMWEDARDVVESKENETTRHVESFGFSQIVKDAKKHGDFGPTASKQKDSASDLRLRKTSGVKRSPMEKISRHGDAFDDTTTIESDSDAFSEISGRNQSASMSTNPFSRITRAFGKDVSMRGGGDAGVLSSDVASINSDDDIGKTTQKSAATVRTHISDVDVAALLMSDDGNSDVDAKINTETFGAFTNVVRNIHSQSSQKMSSGFSQPDGDNLLSDDESEGSDAFAKVFASPKKDGYLSPLSTDDEEDNFATMFGFKNGKNQKKKRW